MQSLMQWKIQNKLNFIKLKVILTKCKKHKKHSAFEINWFWFQNRASFLVSYLHQTHRNVSLLEIAFSSTPAGGGNGGASRPVICSGGPWGQFELELRLILSQLQKNHDRYIKKCVIYTSIISVNDTSLKQLWAQWLFIWYRNNSRRRRLT